MDPELDPQQTQQKMYLNSNSSYQGSFSLLSDDAAAQMPSPGSLSHKLSSETTGSIDGGAKKDVARPSSGAGAAQNQDYFSFISPPISGEKQDFSDPSGGSMHRVAGNRHPKPKSQLLGSNDRRPKNDSDLAGAYSAIDSDALRGGANIHRGSSLPGLRKGSDSFDDLPRDSSRHSIGQQPPSSNSAGGSASAANSGNQSSSQRANVHSFAAVDNIQEAYQSALFGPETFPPVPRGFREGGSGDGNSHSGGGGEDEENEHINNLMGHLDLGAARGASHPFGSAQAQAQEAAAAAAGMYLMNPAAIQANQLAAQASMDFTRSKPRMSRQQQQHMQNGNYGSGMMKGAVKLPMRPGQPDCQYFLRTGRCAYADKCRYTHRQSLRTLLLENIANGDCLEYIMTGFCKYKNCKYNHNQKRRREYMFRAASLLSDETDGGSTAYMQQQQQHLDSPEDVFQQGASGSPSMGAGAGGGYPDIDPASMAALARNGFALPAMSGPGGAGANPYLLQLQQEILSSGGGGGNRGPSNNKNSNRRGHSSQTDCMQFIVTGSCPNDDSCRFNHPNHSSHSHSHTAGINSDFSAARIGEFIGGDEAHSEFFEH